MNETRCRRSHRIRVETARNRVLAALTERHDLQSPRVGIILGTGMSLLIHRFRDAVEIPYSEIPNFVQPTVAGHRGSLVLGFLGQVPIVAMNGRFHFYEGYSEDEICFPVDVMASLGIKRLIIGNASGGVNPKFASGEVMVIEDQIDLLFRPREYWNPRWIGTDHGPFKTPVYDRKMIEFAVQIGQFEKLVLHQGVYAALAGPNYETRSEYRFLRKIGADTVGMSTIPESLRARKLQIPVCGLSTITNVAQPDSPQITDHQAVMDAVKRAEKTLTVLVSRLVEYTPHNESEQLS